MINYKLLYKILGSLLLLEAMFILVCIGVSLFYHEDDIMAFPFQTEVSLQDWHCGLWDVMPTMP